MSGGYANCPCCDDVIVRDDDDESPLCRDCEHAGCLPSEDENGPLYGDCQIPKCEHCGVQASLCYDEWYYSNCVADDDCPNAGKSWPA